MKGLLKSRYNSAVQRITGLLENEETIKIYQKNDQISI